MVPTSGDLIPERPLSTPPRPMAIALPEAMRERPRRTSPAGGPGDERVDVAGPAVDLGAAAGDVGDEVAGVGERGAVVLAHPPGRGGMTGRITSSPDRAYGTTIVRTSKGGGGIFYNEPPEG